MWLCTLNNHDRQLRGVWRRQTLLNSQDIKGGDDFTASGQDGKVSKFGEVETVDMQCTFLTLLLRSWLRAVRPASARFHDLRACLPVVQK